MIDKALKKYGYELTGENYFGAYYTRHDTEFDYDQEVCIRHARNGKHIIQSYDKSVYKVNGRYICEVSGVELPVQLLLWMKAQWLKVKYGWRRK